MKKRQLSLIFFIIAQMYVYIMAMCFNSVINVKIFSIICPLLCLVMGCFLFCKSKDYYIMIISLFLNLIADFFYIFFNRLNYVFFIIANVIQILYFLRIYLDSKYKKQNIIVRLVGLLFIAVLSLTILKEYTNLISILWCIYTMNLFINILFTIKEIGIDNSFPIALILLFIYSAFLMIYGLENYTTINLQLANLVSQINFDLRLMFYMPAQIIMTCSIFTVNKKSFSLVKKEDDTN